MPLPFITWVTCVCRPFAVAKAVRAHFNEQLALECERDQARRERDIAQRALMECEAENRHLRATVGLGVMRTWGLQ